MKEIIRWLKSHNPFRKMRPPEGDLPLGTLGFCLLCPHTRQATLLDVSEAQPYVAEVVDLSTGKFRNVPAWMGVPCSCGSDTIFPVQAA